MAFPVGELYQRTDAIEEICNIIGGRMLPAALTAVLPVNFAMIGVMSLFVSGLRRRWGFTAGCSGEIPCDFRKKSNLKGI